MSISNADQVSYATGLTVTTGGVTTTYADGAILPAAVTDTDRATRAALRVTGAIRLVTVATSAADFAAAVAADAVAADAAAGMTGLPDLDAAGGTVIANY